MNTIGKFLSEIPGSEVIQLDAKYFPHPWSPDQWRGLDPMQSRLFTWRELDQLIGYALFGVSPHDDTAHLFKILIIPEKRGTQSTDLFWSALLSELRKLTFRSVYLEVEASNGRAIKFYEKCGFQSLRTNKAYYSNGEDALIMSLTL